MFEAMDIAHWLARTDHGNNPEAVADAAASAAPFDFDIADAAHVASVDALLTLRAVLGEAVGGVSRDELLRRAVEVDPGDECLTTEVSATPLDWAEWADQLADAAYSPLQASRLIERRHVATTSAAGSAGPLTDDAEALLRTLARALKIDGLAEIVLSGTVSPSLAARLASDCGEEVDVVATAAHTDRGIRRRLLCEGRYLASASTGRNQARLFIARLPSIDASTVTGILHAADELALGMRDHDRAILLAPAAVLVDPVEPAHAMVRTDVLRSGRVRALVRLPAGLITSAPRVALALWVLGRETGEVAIADRFTAVADLTDATLTAASSADLTSDVLAAMGSARDVKAHAFRFARLARTTSLLASSGALVGRPPASPMRARSVQDLPALLDRTLAELGEDAPHQHPTSAPGGPVGPARVEDLIAARHLSVLRGARLAPDDFAESGLVVVGGDELDGASRVGDRRVDQLTFAARHPSARLTLAGDIIFQTTPTAKAWVDPDGSKVVAYPARVLRINRSDPAGLVPELIAADISHSLAGPSAWRRWTLRRVAPRAAAPLREALSDIAIRRAALDRRIQSLDTYAELLTDAVAAGVVSVPFPDAVVASNTQ